MTAAPREPLLVRFKRFLRSSLVGIIATAIDFLVLEIFMRGFGYGPTFAKVFSLAAGTTTQFLGSRYYAFRAQAGVLNRQLRWFVVVEFCAYWVTVLVFHGLVRWLRLPAEIANFASGSIVYFGFSYPLWHAVFKLTPEEQMRAAEMQRAEEQRRALDVALKEHDATANSAPADAAAPSPPPPPA